MQILVRPAVGSDAERLAQLMTQLGYPADAGAMRTRLAYWLPDPASRVLMDAAERLARAGAGRYRRGRP